MSERDISIVFFFSLVFLSDKNWPNFRQNWNVDWINCPIIRRQSKNTIVTSWNWSTNKSNWSDAFVTTTIYNSWSVRSLRGPNNSSKIWNNGNSRKFILKHDEPLPVRIPSEFNWLPAILKDFIKFWQIPSKFLTGPLRFWQFSFAAD